MASVLVNEGSLSAIAGAIRGKLDVDTLFKPSQMASAIESIETGGSEFTAEDIGKVVTGSGGVYALSQQTSRSVTENGTYDTTLNNEVTVSVSGGGGGGSLGFDILLLGATGVLEHSSASNIRASACMYNAGVTGISFPACKVVETGAFSACRNLSFASLPICSDVQSRAFNACSALTDVNLPEVVTLGNSAFASCTSISHVSLSKVEDVGDTAFFNCTSLSQISLPAVTAIGNSAFAGCSKLMSLYILGDSVCTLGGTSVFANTPMSRSTYTGSFGSIFVPSSLYEAYISASRWSTYSARIASYTEA